MAGGISRIIDKWSVYEKTLQKSTALYPQAAEIGVQAGNNIAVVQTQAGKVQGYVQNGVVTYKGMPYATAERFMPPQKVANWQGEKLALTYGEVCPQVPMGGHSFFFTGPEITEGESCLNLKLGRLRCQTANKMSRAWTNFAKSSNPNAEGLPQWDAYTREKW